MNRHDQHLHNARIQREWAAMALRDSKYNQKRADEEYAAGNRILASQYSKEAEVDLAWHNKRMMIAKREESMANGRTGGRR